MDRVKTMVLTRCPDGSTRTEAADGALILRVTNTATGNVVDVDISGSALIDHGTDGSLTYDVFGPVALGVRADGGNLPRGLYLVDGAYRIVISPTRYRP